MSINYRVAKLEDYHDVNHVLAESLHLHAEALPDLFDKEAYLFTPQQYQSIMYYSTVEIILAEHNQNIVGASVVELNYNPPLKRTPPSYTAFIQFFSVKREYQQLGIGKELFEVTKEWAKAKGALDLQLTVWSFNEKAIRFYEKLGLCETSKLMRLKLN
ncbi:GNAT family N-acetyltransferase [Metabacillus iocasae]|uniref:Ribosomal protein S18 acetylase RimI-like enzyme n=1 Tax=Priestia iocasae TaxID=2291674 RepID=A0ABS2QSS8_9BACI|nr:GNAT family N-acetyltransferase [Metabacillus iocasae]MBM7702520.1 ribosomal protein S18 acetylase RimI-like enzyme [Metabacillus iocasae]